MPPRKEPKTSRFQSSNTSQQPFITQQISNHILPRQFIMNFLQTNYERREVQTKQFSIFAEYVKALFVELLSTPQMNMEANAKTIVKIVEVIKYNFEEVTKISSSFCIYIDIIDSCFNKIVKKANSLFEKQSAYLFLKLVEPLDGQTEKEESFADMEEILKSFPLLDQIKNLEESSKSSKNSQKSMSETLLQKLQKISNCMLYDFNESQTTNSLNTIDRFNRAYLTCEGGNYLQAFISFLHDMIENSSQNDIQVNKKKIQSTLNIYLQIGEESEEKKANFKKLISQIGLAKSQLCMYFYDLLLKKVNLQCLLSSTQIMQLVIYTTSNVLFQKAYMTIGIEIMSKLANFSFIFAYDDLIVDDKTKLYIENLPNKIIDLLIKGKLEKSKLTQKKLDRYFNMPQKQLQHEILDFELSDSMQEIEENQKNLRKNIKKQKQEKMVTIPLSKQQVMKVVYAGKRILKAIQQSQKLSKILQGCYSSQHVNVKQLIFILNKASLNNIQCIGSLLLEVYCPMLCNVQEFMVKETSKSNSFSSILLIMMQIKLLQHIINSSDFSQQQLVQEHYKPIHELFTISDTNKGLNYQFVMLLTLHQQIQQIENILSYAISRFETQPTIKNLDNIGFANKYKCTVALIASILSVIGQINIQFTTGIIKNKFQLLNKQFKISYFLTPNSIKENKLFLKNRYNISSTKCSISEETLTKISNFMSQLMKECENNPQLICTANNTDVDENNCYYFVLIQLLNWCEEKCPSFANRSTLKKTILQLRYNNQLSRPLTLYSVLLEHMNKFLGKTTYKIGDACINNPERQPNAKKIQQNSIKQDLIKHQNKQQQLIIILHLLIKIQKFKITNKLKTKDNFKYDPIEQQIYEQLRKCSLQLIKLISKIPNFQILIIIDGIIQKKIYNSSHKNQNSSQIQVDAKQILLNQCMNKMEMIKFHVEAAQNPQLLKFMIIHYCLNLIEIRNDEINEKEYKFYTYMRILFCINEECNDQNQKMRLKYAQTLIKSCILSTYIDKIYNGGSSYEQRQGYIEKLLQTLSKNHKQLSQILQLQINSKNIKNNESNEKDFMEMIQIINKQLLGSPFHLISSIFDIIFSYKNIDRFKYGEIELSILKTVLEIVKNSENIRKMFQYKIMELQKYNRLEGKDLVLTSLANENNQYLTKIYNHSQVINQIQVQVQSESDNFSLDRKLLENIVKQQKIASQKLSYKYLLLSKIGQESSQSFTTNEISQFQQFHEQIIMQLLQCIQRLVTNDKYTSIYATIYIYDQIFNISACLYEIYNSSQFNQQVRTNIQAKLTELSEYIAQYIKKTIESYSNTKIYNIQASLSILKPSNSNISIALNMCTIDFNTIVSYFISKFYHIADIGVLNQINRVPISNSNIQYFPISLHSANIGDQHKKDEEYKLSCLGTTRKSVFRCLTCNYANELCYNCVISCHISHPIAFVPQSMAIFKTCQCKEHGCKINPIQEDKNKSPSLPKGRRQKHQRKDSNDDKEKYIIKKYERKRLIEQDQQQYQRENLRPEVDQQRVSLPSLSLNLENKLFRFSSGISQSIDSNYSDENALDTIIGNNRSFPRNQYLFSAQLTNPSLGLGRIKPRASGLPRGGLLGTDSSQLRPLGIRQQIDYTQVQYVGRQRSGRKQNQNLSHQIQPVSTLNYSNQIQQEYEQTKYLKEVDYEQSNKKLSKVQSQFKFNSKKQLNKTILLNKINRYDLLLPMSFQLLRNIFSQKQLSQSLSKTMKKWNIKFQPQIPMTNRILNPATNTCKIINTGIQTKLRRHEGQYSPCVSKTSFATDSAYVYILNNNTINVFSRETLYTILMNGKQIQKAPYNYAIPLQFEPHSIGIWQPKNIICVCGLKNVVVLNNNYSIPVSQFDIGLRVDQFEFSRSFQKYSVSNEYINKMTITKFGIFLGLGREIRLLSFDLILILTIKLPDALIKQWCVYIETPQSSNFTVYATINDGYVLFVQANDHTTGQLAFIQNVNDSRPNRPVGSFVTVKNTKNCGVLMLSSFKDKNIGHSFGTLEGNILKNINYIKLNTSNTTPLFKSHSMGLTQILQKNIDQQQQKQTGKQLYMITTLKQQLNDPLSIHRGLLGIIKIEQKNQSYQQFEKQFKEEKNIQENKIQYTEKAEIQILNNESKCQYFESIVLKDSKQWFVLSLHQDGNLLMTMPEKINKNTIEREILALVQLRKNKMNGNNENLLEKVLNNSQDINKNTEESETVKFEKLSKEEKAKSMKKQISKNIQVHNSITNCISHYKFLQGSQLLKYKDDYTFTVDKCKSLQGIKLTMINPRKIVTGLAFMQQCDVILPWKEYKNVLEIGLSYEESLLLYSMDSLQIIINKKETCYMMRQNAKNQVFDQLKKRRSSDLLSPQEKTLLQRMQNKQKVQDIIVYGQEFDEEFSFKAIKNQPNLMKMLLHKNIMHLERNQKLSIVLQNCSVLLTNYIRQYWAINKKLDPDFNLIELVDFLKEKILQQPKLSNRIYQLFKNVMNKVLIISHLRQNQHLSHLHVFNDLYYPLRFATQWKIDQLYQQLTIAQISLNSLNLLIDQLYGLCGGPEVLTLLDSNLGIMANKDYELLTYYIAKYPAMLAKINKRIKNIDNKNNNYKLIPIYLVGYIALSYLSYRTQWILPAVFNIVGQKLPSESEPVVEIPNPYYRVLLYKYLKQLIDFEPQAWLKNVQPIDSKQQKTQTQKNIPRTQSMAIQEEHNEIFDLQMMEGLDEEIRREIQFFQKEYGQTYQALKKNKEPEMEEKQHENMMESEQGNGSGRKLFQAYIDQSLKQIDYNNTNVQKSSQRAIALSVMYQLGLQNLRNSIENETISYLFKGMEKAITKLCQNYKENLNQSTRNIIIMYLCLFGLIYRNCMKIPEFGKQNELEQSYSLAKQQILEVLQKFKNKIDTIPKISAISNNFMKVLYGKSIQTKLNIIYGFINVLQYPCEPDYVLLALQCFWLFPYSKEYYQNNQYIDTIREAERTGNVKKMHEKVLSNVLLWKKVGDPSWLENWITEKKQDWTLALELLILYYE